MVYDHDTDAKVFNKNMKMNSSTAGGHSGHDSGTSDDTDYRNDFYYRYPSKFSVDQVSKGVSVDIPAIQYQSWWGKKFMQILKQCLNI